MYPELSLLPWHLHVQVIPPLAAENLSRVLEVSYQIDQRSHSLETSGEGWLEMGCYLLLSCYYTCRKCLGRHWVADTDYCVYVHCKVLFWFACTNLIYLFIWKHVFVNEGCCRSFLCATVCVIIKHVIYTPGHSVLNISLYCEGPSSKTALLNSSLLTLSSFLRDLEDTLLHGK